MCNAVYCTTVQYNISKDHEHTPGSFQSLTTALGYLLCSVQAEMGKAWHLLLHKKITEYISLCKHVCKLPQVTPGEWSSCNEKWLFPAPGQLSQAAKSRLFGCHAVRRRCCSGWGRAWWPYKPPLACAPQTQMGSTPWPPMRGPWVPKALPKTCWPSWAACKPRSAYFLPIL